MAAEINIKLLNTMKKTLITLLSLAGVAMAGVDGNWAGNFSWGSGETPLTFTFTDGNSPLTIDSVSAVMTAVPSDADPTPEAVTAVYKTTTYQAGTFTPDVNVGDGGTWTLTLNFTNNSTERMDITAITLGVFSFTGGGVSQGNDTERPIIITMSGAMTGITNHTTKGAGTGSLEQVGLVMDDTLTLEAGASIALNFNVKENNTLGTFVGLTGATFSIIPEPATATLSLLALCGLAARRRRQ